MELEDITIYCFGDSHVSVFSGSNMIAEEWPNKFDTLPYFSCYRLGPYLAWNTGNPQHPVRVKLEELFSRIPPQSFVLFSFGEIDCRAHLVSQSIKQGESLDDIAKLCVNTYLSFLLEMKSRWGKVFVYGIPPTILDDTSKAIEYNAIGSFEDRKALVSSFNAHLERVSNENGLIYIGINDLLEAEPDYRTKYFNDCVHLSTNTLPFIIKRIKEGLLKR